MGCEGISASDVCDDGRVLCENDRVSSDDYVVDAYEGYVEADGNKREDVRTDMGLFLNRFGFHVAVVDGSAWGCGTNCLHPV